MVKKFFGNIKEKFNKTFGYDEEEQMIGDEGYLELDTDDVPASKAKVIVKPYVLEDFTDVKAVLDDLRDGVTIALINIRPLKEKDIVELKRAINKLKKTTEAIEGDIAGFGEDWLVVAPAFAQIHRAPKQPKSEELDAE